MQVDMLNGIKNIKVIMLNELSQRLCILSASFIIGFLIGSLIVLIVKRKKDE